MPSLIVDQEKILLKLEKEDLLNVKLLMYLLSEEFLKLSSLLLLMQEKLHSKKQKILLNV